MIRQALLITTAGVLLSACATDHTPPASAHTRRRRAPSPSRRAPAAGTATGVT